MSTAAHRIRYQRWELRAPDRDTAFSLRSQMRQEIDSVLMPALERAFDALDRGGEVVRLSRLTLKIQVRNLEELAARLPALVEEQLGEALSEAAARIPGAIRRRPAAAQRRLSLLHYLYGGQLDWPDAQGEVTLQAAVLREEAIRLARDWLDQPAAMRQVLPAPLAATLAFFYRLLQLLPSARRDEWTPALLAAAPARNDSRGQALGRWPPVHDARPAEHALLQLQAIALGLAWADTIPASPALKPFLLALPGVDAQTAQALAAWLHDEGKPMGEPGVTTPVERRERRNADAHHTEQDSLPVPPDAVSIRSGDAPFDTPPQSDQTTNRPSADDAADSTAARVSCAGLVLAHPFLGNLFAARGLLGEDGKSISPFGLPRAAALLHWLACGREAIFEFELGLIKALLGLQPSDPLPVTQGLLDSDDRDECRALLAAMVTHWAPLRSTSVEGLQVSFLQRHGLLRPTDTGWQLQIESEPFDLLLAQLPWSISLVKLPWMTKPIFTDWPSP